MVSKRQPVDEVELPAEAREDGVHKTNNKTIAMEALVDLAATVDLVVDMEEVLQTLMVAAVPLRPEQADTQAQQQ